MATLKGMRQQISYKLDQALDSSTSDVPTNAFWTATQMNAWINEGYFLMYARLAEVEAQTLVTEATATYTADTRRISIYTLLSIANDPLKIVGVWDITDDTSANGLLLPYVPYQQMQGRASTSSDVVFSPAGQGHGWTWSGSDPMYIYVWPVPSSDMTLRMQYIPAEPSTLTADGNIPSALPSSLHGLLISYAVVQAKRKEEDPSWKDDFSLYNETFDAFINSVEERQSQSSRMVFVTEYADGFGGYYLR